MIYYAPNKAKCLKLNTTEKRRVKKMKTHNKPTKPTKSTATLKAKPKSSNNHLVVTLFDTTIETLARAIHTSRKATIDFKETEIECCDTLIPTKNGVVFIGTAKQAQSAFDREAKGIIKLQPAPVQRKINIRPLSGKKATKE